MEILYVVLAIVAVVAIYLFFSRKPSQAPRALPKEEEKKLAEKREAKEPAQPSKAPKAKSEKPGPAASERPRSVPAPVKEEKVEAALVGEEPAPSRVPSSPPTSKAKKRDVEGLRQGLAKSRDEQGFFGRLRSLFSGRKQIDPELLGEIEEVLISSDVGVKTTHQLLAHLREAADGNGGADGAWSALREEATKILSIGGGGISLRQHPSVVMFVGVNGVGKTTSIGKLATKLKADGKKVVLAAGDTFRAAAVQQLQVWGKRVGCEVVSGKDGSNPGAVIFEAIQKAQEIGADVVLADTAGRLHTKTNLMDELSKVSRSMSKAMEGAPHEVLLVVDATNGQNAMQQAALFKETLPLTGMILTKLDGTAKGGIILGISAEHGIPVRYVGVGERAEDLREFDADEFVEAMLGQPGQADAAA